MDNGLWYSNSYKLSLVADGNKWGVHRIVQNDATCSSIQFANIPAYVGQCGEVQGIGINYELSYSENLPDTPNALQTSKCCTGSNDDACTATSTDDDVIGVNSSSYMLTLI